MIRAKILVRGDVQGVGFRWSVKRNAELLGIKGFAKNLADRSVEVVAEGGKESIRRLVEFCKKGPGFANVKALDVSYYDFKNEFNDFRIL